MTDETVEVVVGYLATHTDGTVARLGPDRTRAELYAVTHHATIEMMYVRRRPAQTAHAPGETFAGISPRRAA